ncbi:MAG: VF530 family protein [Candidatus Omnitrophica bacterium]|nr:VF530 family protein [Candidatus Omnitrophota bacterium]MBU1997600.1 VF530 family protein [Candidatus Omnitrophota bacterium]MBU4333862.1 VF530 family protein [Candidatus Omnitrophota bacterium]
MTSQNDNELRKSKDPLHGVTLEMMLERLKEAYGWEKLGRVIKINCFNQDPSISSSLKFLRRTPWAREKVESFYLNALRQNVKFRDAFLSPDKISDK